MKTKEIKDKESELKDLQSFILYLWDLYLKKVYELEKLLNIDN